MTLAWSLVAACLACNSAIAETPATTRQGGDPAFKIDARESVRYLASDELEGRGVGTAGIDKAADYIANAFQKLGLQPLGDHGTYFQTFQMTTATAPANSTSLAVTTAEEPKTDYTLGAQFLPLSFSGEGKFEGQVVFAGYGISNKEREYDDYASIDVKDKVVLMLRFEPHNEKGASRFSPHGGDWSEDATLARKATVAAERGAKAMVLVNPPNYHRGDLLMPFAQLYRGDQAKLPVIQVTQETANRWLKAGGAEVDLKGLQAKIDESGKPHSLALPEAVTVSGNVEVERTKREVKNVVAKLQGTGPAAEEYVVVGAHYDHLGRGGEGSLSRGSKEIHNGADDNASGTTAMLKLAEHYARSDAKPARSMVFAAFTAEESGLIGSNYFVNHPPIGLDKVAAMLNLDMVGRVNKNSLAIGGQATAPSFEKFLKEADERSPLELKSGQLGRGGLGPSDHMSFALKKIPVLFFWSGTHRDYHRPTDDADKINYDGLEQVVKLGVDVLDRLRTMPREQYVDAADAHSAAGRGGAGGSRVILGIVPDYAAEDVKGVKISGTTPDTPAAAAGLKDGDVIVQWNETKLESIYTLMEQLAKGNPGDKVKLRVQRGSEQVELEATLAERKG